VQLDRLGIKTRYLCQADHTLAGKRTMFDQPYKRKE